MQQKSTLVRLDPSLAFEPVFQDCQGASPWHELNENAPEQGADVNPAQHRASPGEERACRHPQDEERVNQERGGCQDRVDALPKDDNEHEALLEKSYAERLRWMNQKAWLFLIKSRDLQANSHPKRRIESEYEPQLPIEIKLIWYTFGTGVVLLAAL